MNLQCTQCNSDNVTSLSVLFDQGTTHVQTKSTSVGVGLGSNGSVGIGGATGTTHGTHQNVSAQKAAPPSPKNVAGWIGTTILAALPVLGIFEGTLKGFISGLIFGVITYFCIKKVRSLIEYNKTEFPLEYARWQRSFSCMRCGNVFEFSR